MTLMAPLGRTRASPTRTTTRIAISTLTPTSRMDGTRPSSSKMGTSTLTLAQGEMVLAPTSSSRHKIRVSRWRPIYQTLATRLLQLDKPLIPSQNHLTLISVAMEAPISNQARICQTSLWREIFLTWQWTCLQSHRWICLMCRMDHQVASLFRVQPLTSFKI